MFPVYIIVGLKLNKGGEEKNNDADLERSKELDEDTLNLTTKEESLYDDQNPEDASETNILRNFDEISADVKKKRSDKMAQMEIEKAAPASDNPHEMEHEENWLSAIAFPMRIIFEKIINYEKMPVVTVAGILVVFFQFIKHILYMVGKISALFHLTPVFIGLCVICWGSNINDVMNLTVAHKKGVLQLGMTAVFGS